MPQHFHAHCAAHVPALGATSAWHISMPTGGCITKSGCHAQGSLPCLTSQIDAMFGWVAGTTSCTPQLRSALSRSWEPSSPSCRQHSSHSGRQTLPWTSLTSLGHAGPMLPPGIWYIYRCTCMGRQLLWVSGGMSIHFLAC